MPSPTSLSSVRADAIARRDRGDLHTARTILERALEAVAMTSGEDHPEVLSTAALLAKFHRQSGDLSGARRVLENALYAGTHRHGEEHPLLLSISFDLAEIADELGNRHEARKHYTRVARYGPAAPGFDQQQVQAARAWLGPSAPAVPPVHGLPVTLPAPEQIITPQRFEPAPIPRADPAPAPPPRVEPAPTRSTPPGFEPAPIGSAPPSFEPAPTRSPPLEPAPATPPRFEPAPNWSVPPESAPTPSALLEPASDALPRFVPPAWVEQPTEDRQPVARWASVDAPTAGLPIIQVPQAQAPVPVPYQVAVADVGRPYAYPREKRGKGMLIGSLAAALVAVAAAGVTVFLVLRPQDRDPVPPGPEGAPTNVVLLDGGDRITLTWTDPSKGNAQPIVVGNREDEAARRMGLPTRGATETTLLSLNKNYDYCFSIVLAYSVDDLRQSDQVCTNRKKSSSSPIS